MKRRGQKKLNFFLYITAGINFDAKKGPRNGDTVRCVPDQFFISFSWEKTVLQGKDLFLTQTEWH